MLKEKGELGMADLLAEVKSQAAELGETELAEVDADSFQETLAELFEAELIDGDQASITLTEKGQTRFARLEAEVPREAENDDA